MTQQAMQLGLLPRIDIRRTSETQAGQIFLPPINIMLMVGVLLLVVIFQTSDHLATAYGLAVTGTMLVTTLAGLRRRAAAVEVGPLRTAALIGAARWSWT